ncbi:MAG: hypothetical protein ACRDQA_26575 [Nocardioidaceae bacterium]
MENPVDGIEACDECGAAAGEPCEPYCPNNLPTDAELAQDWIDVGTL